MDFLSDDIGDSGLTTQSFGTYSLPYDWQAPKDKEYEDDPSRAQLVICLTGLRKRNNKKIGICKWDIAEGNVYPATYTIEVYVAKTGRRLAVLKIRGDDSADSSCPATVEVRVALGGPDVAQGVKDETLARRLRPFIMGHAH